MHTQILAALKAKFVGVSDAILNRIANRLAQTVTTAEQVATAVEGVTIQSLLESYGDSRATEAQQTAVRNYEAKYGLKDGEKTIPSGGAPIQVQQPVVAPVTNPVNQTQPQGGAKQIPAWAQALVESNKALTDRLAKMEGDRTTATRKTQLQSVVSKLPEALRKPYERISVDGLTDEQFNTLVSEVTTEVDGLASTLTQKGAVFGSPTAPTGGGNSQELTEAQQKAVAHRDNKPTSADGQPF